MTTTRFAETSRATPILRRAEPRVVAVLFSAVAAAAFLIVSPPVGDLWAARARASAAIHGVGLDYWFAWFGGTVPGQYSVLAPYLARLLDVGLLGAAASVVVTFLTARLVRGSHHPVAATWAAAIGMGFSLWSGRVPFALGTAGMIATLLAVRHARRYTAVAAGVVTALLSPVSGAFLVLGLAGVIAHDRRRRLTAILTAGSAALCLLIVALYFGLPGPEGFPILHAAAASGAVAAMLLARPARYVRTVLLVSLLACPVLLIVPNGLGTNFERFTWICLPVATVATAQARLVIARLAPVLGLLAGIVGSAHDLAVAADPMSSPSYSAGLVSELDRLDATADYRLEVVPDGTHVAAYALLNHAQLARGFETQEDHAVNSVLYSSTLTPASYRTWLDQNAVRWVAIDTQTLTGSPEDTLVRHGRLRYLHRIWSDAHWTLFEVTAATPIISRPARIVRAGQAAMEIAVPTPGQYALHVRWSRFLQLRSGQGQLGDIKPDSHGWTTMFAPTAGRYQLTG